MIHPIATPLSRRYERPCQSSIFVAPQGAFTGTIAIPFSSSLHVKIGDHQLTELPEVCPGDRSRSSRARATTL
jgi:hypothetical protein